MTSVIVQVEGLLVTNLQCLYSVICFNEKEIDPSRKSSHQVSTAG